MQRRPTVNMPHGGPYRGTSTYVDRHGTTMQVEMEYLEVAGRLTLYGISLRTYERDTSEGTVARSLNDDWRAITTELVRGLAVGRMERDNRDHITPPPAPEWDEGATWDVPGLVWDSDELERRRLAVLARSSGRERYPDDHWDAVAAVYRNAYAAGKHPAAEVAATFHVKPTRARSWIRRCRELGRLPVTTERKPMA